MNLYHLLGSSILCVAVLAACTHGQSSTSSQSAAPSSVAMQAPSAATQAATETSPSAASGLAIPEYPGSQPSCGQSFTNCVSETTDSFETVYNWYKTHLPNGSEQTVPAFMKRPVADLRVGDADVLINTPNAGKTQMNITDDQR